MLLGIDVGGTHTDAVMIATNGIHAAAKVPTDHEDLLASVNAAIGEILRDVDPDAIRQINLSTTLTTNAIIEEKLEPVGMLVTGGPGIAPGHYTIGRHFHLLRGAIDHRGTEQEPLPDAELDAAVEACRAAGVRVFGAVTKFSPRNPVQEEQIVRRLQPDADFISIGHTLSGRLNFPRRVATAFYNSAVWRAYIDFIDAVETGVRKHGISARMDILKADGGTMPAAVSRTVPVQSILSGPAASIMGIVALCDIDEDAVILDIGGTTTDIAVFADGAPLVEPDGIAIGGHPTLVRAVITRSIGIGGDSEVVVENGDLRIGPRRRGPALACGGPVPTLIDAGNVTGTAQVGNPTASAAGFRELAAATGIDPEELARRAIARAMEQIRDAAHGLVTELNARPVYTIHELLTGKTLSPRQVYVMGGPAAVLAEPLAQAFGLPVTVPARHAVANAIGAALTRTTMEIELLADTERKELSIPNLDIRQKISFQFTLADAVAAGREHLLAFLRRQQIEDIDDDMIQVVEADSFNMISNYFTVGRNIRVSCQLKPSIRAAYREAVR
ncbi:MAG: hydantoinase/oxoprolinase family protein [Deltaproteobacteria bacterium]|nr:hydantoinase/oxoprolinase family protein [Candidatus Anaeroferrophillacea bacterium]